MPKPHTSTTGQEASDSTHSQDQQDPSSDSLAWEESKEKFTEECLFTARDLEDNSELEETGIFTNRGSDLVLPKSDAVDAFNEWQSEHLRKENIPEEPTTTSEFTVDVIKPFAKEAGVKLETSRPTLDGERTGCYKKFGLTEIGEKFLISHRC